MDDITANLICIKALWLQNESLDMYIRYVQELSKVSGGMNDTALATYEEAIEFRAIKLIGRSAANSIGYYEVSES